MLVVHPARTVPDVHDGGRGGTVPCLTLKVEAVVDQCSSCAVLPCRTLDVAPVASGDKITESHSQNNCQRSVLRPGIKSVVTASQQSASTIPCLWKERIIYQNQ